LSLERHIKKAQDLFGPHATVVKRPAGKYTKGSLKGKCGTCFALKCRKKWNYTIGVVEGGGLYLAVKGRGHTLKEAWEKAKT
jgi:hypothetical protein